MCIEPASTFEAMRWKVAQWFELKWWQRYLDKKAPEKYLDWKTEYWRKFLKEIDIDLSVDQVAVDAGCGPAGIFTVLPSKKTYAVDPLIDAYQTNLPHFQPDRYPNVVFIKSKFEETHIPEKADFVFCLNVINHVHHLNKAYDVLITTLKEDGTLVLSIDAHNFTFLKWLFRLLPLDILHPHQYDLGEYENALIMRGLSIKKSVLYSRGFIFNYHILVASKA